MRTPRRRKLGALGALSLGWAAITLAALVAPGCYGRVCEPSSVTFGADAGEGRMIDEDTWESAPIDGRWIPFPGNRTVFFDVPALGDRTPWDYDAYISPVVAPFAPGSPPSDMTLASGNLAVVFGPGPNRLAIRNSSCAEYSLRVILRAYPRPPAAEPLPSDGDPDAGTPPTGTSDAGRDDASSPGDAAADGEAGP